jgi:Acetyltransferase (GNAT) family
MGSVSDICIRLAQLSDRDQLVRMHVALWPKTSAEEHARELNLILEGKPVVTTPLIILVAEVSDGVLAGFLEVDLRSHADGCNPSRPVGYIEGWYVAENHRHKGIAGDFWPRQKTGHATRGALRWHRTPGSTMRCRNACMRRWGMRWWTAVCTTVSRCDIHPETRHSVIKNAERYHRKVRRCAETLHQC